MYRNVAGKYICGRSFQILRENNIKIPWLGQLDIYTQKNEFESYFIPYTKINPK
jgi:hypothetical protein